MLDLNANELEILDYWRNNDILGKLRARNKGKKPFYFLDGPPYVTGDLHPGQMWVKAIKDITLRYRRFRGYDVRDMPGYDVHGLPIENKVEKKLELKSKQDIETKIGVESFIKECRAYVDEGIGRMDSDYERFGITLDFAHPYIPYKSSYIEAAWSMFKRISDNGLLYNDTKTTLYCPRCQTPVSQGTMEAEYKEDNDPSIAVTFKVVKNGSNAKIDAEEGSYSLLIWTTTPWTLPANVAVAVNPKELYVLAKFGGRLLIVAKKRTDAVASMLNESAVITGEFYGSELEGLEYANPLEQFVPMQKELRSVHKVICEEGLVTMDEGTGLVHIAPGHGLEDYNAGMRRGLPIFSPVAGNAEYTKEAGKYEHLVVPDEANKAVIADLKQIGALLFNGSITHSYPHCWRCDSKLIFIATPQWFFDIQKVKKKMLAENAKAKWHPDEAKAWQADVLSNSPDWCISRQRYWGIPLPIWICEKCGERQVIGSLEELRESATDKHSVDSLTDLHRPYIDAVELRCKKCGSDMQRVKDVADVWFDSSIAFRASISEESEFQRLFPVDYIIEGKDQLRGWFSGLIKVGVLAYGRCPFKHIGVDGMLLAEDGREMHKKLGNYVPVRELTNIVSADAFRLWSVSHTPWLDMMFSRRELKDAERTISILYNTANLISEYGRLINAYPKWNKTPKKPDDLEDRWIMSRLQSLIIDVTDAYENYESHIAANKIRYFVNEDFSRFYLKVAKKKLLGSSKLLQRSTMQIVGNVLSTVLILAAPIIPFTSEYISLKMLRSAEESVFMEKWPKGKSEYISKELEAEFEIAKSAISAILNAREAERIPLRWPISKATIEAKGASEYNTLLRYSNLIAEYTNSKAVDVKSAQKVGLEAKPQFQKIGPEFKGMANAVAEAIADTEPSEIKKGFESDGSYTLHTKMGPARIRPEHVSLLEFSMSENMKPFEGGYVAIEKELSEGLLEEAMVRELARRIQLERKGMGLKRSDAIEIYIDAESQVGKAIESFSESLKRSLNAKRITLTKEFPESLSPVPVEVMDTSMRVAIRAL
ncbi:MAG: isoleucine--tRNA ligase [Candidatus Marsarchaeota archaeon]|nr:isoleucine--tRNA ligase [Candidatus Marsarchaeota archaeon]